MKWIAATVSATADAATGEAVAEIIADLFYGLGLKGVVINETETAANGEEVVSVTGYFPDNDQIRENRSRLETSVRNLSGRGVSTGAVTYERIDEEDWADSWKAHFHPQRIGRHIVVKPTWRDYAAGHGDIVIEIDPGMAFGTGTHATTSMCLKMLERHFKPGMSFLDVGTGTGILMVAAFMMGADVVRGIDNDPVAVEIAGANLDLNRVPRDRSGVLSAHLIDGVSGKFDMVCANILAEVVMELIPDLAKVLAPGGMVICSGIINARREAVEGRLRQSGFRIIDRLTEEDWVCLAAVERQSGLIGNDQR